MALVRGSDLTFDIPNASQLSVPYNRNIDPGREFHLLDCAFRQSTAGPFCTFDASIGGPATTFEVIKGPGGGCIGNAFSIATGANAAGRCAWSLGSGTTIFAFNTDFEYMYHRSIVMVPVLSTAGEEFDIVSGFGDVVTASPQTDGAYFQYDRNRGPNWELFVAAGGVRSSISAGPDLVAGVPYELVVEYRSQMEDSGQPAVRGWVNGQIHSRIDAGFPSTTQTFGAMVSIFKSAGVVSRTMIVPWHEVYAKWSIPRGLPIPFQL